MSPLSTAIERFAADHGVPVLEAQEFWAERAAIREYDGGLSREAAESAALQDVEVWAKLWKQLKTDPATQPVLPMGRVAK
jgi:hypothetical protein